VSTPELGTQVTTDKTVVVQHALLRPGSRFTGELVRTFPVGSRLTYAVIRRADGVQGTARIEDVVPA
jgi:hypothetical protein